MQEICILTLNEDKYCVQNNVFAFFACTQRPLYQAHLFNCLSTQLSDQPMT